MPLIGLPLMSGRGHEIPVFFSCAAASATDHSALKTGNIIFFPEGTVQLRVSIFPSVDPARNHICPEGSAGQLSNVVTENAYCHHRALHWPYVSPPTWPFIARTPGLILSANTIVDPKSATTTPTTTRLLRQYFVPSFIIIYLHIARERSATSEGTSRPIDGKCILILCHFIMQQL